MASKLKGKKSSKKPAKKKTAKKRNNPVGNGYGKVKPKKKRLT